VPLCGSRISLIPSWNRRPRTRRQTRSAKAARSARIQRSFPAQQSEPAPSRASRAAVAGTTKQDPGEPYSWPGGPANRTSDPSAPSRRAQHAVTPIRQRPPHRAGQSLPASPPGSFDDRRGGSSCRSTWITLRSSRRRASTTCRSPCTLSPSGRVKCPCRRGIHDHGHGASQRTERRLGVRSPWNYLSLRVMYLSAQRLADIQADMAELLRRLAAGKHTSSRGSQVGSHHRPTLGDLQATKAFDSRFSPGL
jgi:hypothetical protein